MLETNCIHLMENPVVTGNLTRACRQPQPLQQQQQQQRQQRTRTPSGFLPLGPAGLSPSDLRNPTPNSPRTPANLGFRRSKRCSHDKVE
ncbi:Oxysterol-binding protein-related protein 9 [Frankliniella fusca]|uniref:Oxysterol-binding protein-related protein 9 n=1 Tax=Frankliniella fusca TaxID=407009 RepID=A0AAE1L5Q5_9NEOP|nr:Oxysterol-binding protein-related protein 9 [Frankliniella fusca]